MVLDPMYPGEKSTHMPTPGRLCLGPEYAYPARNCTVPGHPQGHTQPSTAPNLDRQKAKHQFCLLVLAFLCKLHQSPPFLHHSTLWGCHVEDRSIAGAPLHGLCWLAPAKDSHSMQCAGALLGYTSSSRGSGPEVSMLLLLILRQMVQLDSCYSWQPWVDSQMWLVLHASHTKVSAPGILSPPKMPPWRGI